MKVTNHRIRIGTLLKQLIAHGYLNFDGEKIVTTAMTDRVIDLWKRDRMNELLQLHINFKDE